MAQRLHHTGPFANREERAEHGRAHTGTERLREPRDPPRPPPCAGKEPREGKRAPPVGPGPPRSPPAAPQPEAGLSSAQAQPRRSPADLPVRQEGLPQVHGPGEEEDGGEDALLGGQLCPQLAGQRHGPAPRSHFLLPPPALQRPLPERRSDAG